MKRILLILMVASLCACGCKNSKNVVVEQKIPAGEIVHVKSMSDYDGKYSIEKPVFDPEKGVYVIQICWFA